MEEPTKMRLTIKMQKKLDSWDRKLSIAKEQEKSAWNTLLFYQESVADVKGRYDEFLKKNNISL